MRILLDESLPRRLKDELPGHDVSTVVECGWSGAKNGKLLTLAAVNFDIFITADQNLQYQQNLAALPISVLVLVAQDSRLETLRALLPEILLGLTSMEPRGLLRVGYIRSGPPEN
jgi:predicted nuclease of predicted toxin-antitoxin system